MTGRLASRRAAMRRWARRGLLLALPLGLLALAAAALALALAPSSIGHRAGARPHLRLLPPTPATSVPAPANHRRFAVAPATVSGGGPTQSRPRRVGQRRRGGE